MLLAIDVGNSNIVLGGYQNGGLCFSARVATDRMMEADQYAVQLKGILELYGVAQEGIRQVVMASVVPSLTPVLLAALAHFSPEKPRLLDISDAAAFDIDVVIDRPAELGMDILASAIAVRHSRPLPAVIIDMGTATKLTALDEKGRLLGVAISPGLYVAFEAMVQKASALRGISLEEPEQAIGRNSPESMKSGVVLGNAAALDGMIDRFAEEMGGVSTIVATGGAAGLVVSCCRHQIETCDTLLLEGLYRLSQG